MKMQLQQESDSLVEITEIDPLDVAEILGQVGGFWDLILILWPLLFVAASEEIPNLKPRNFLKYAVRAKEKVTSVAPAMLHNLSTTSTTRDPPRTTFNDEQGEELPAWEGGGSSSRHQKVQLNASVFVVHANNDMLPQTLALPRFSYNSHEVRHLASTGGMY